MLILEAKQCLWKKREKLNTPQLQYLSDREVFRNLPTQVHEILKAVSAILEKTYVMKF